MPVFKEMLEKWKSKAEEHATAVEGPALKAKELEDRLRLLTQPILPFREMPGYWEAYPGVTARIAAGELIGGQPVKRGPIGEYVVGGVRYEAPVMAGAVRAKWEFGLIKSELQAIVGDMLKNQFYASLYTIVPENIRQAREIVESGEVPDPEVYFSTFWDVIRELQPPAMSPVESSELRSIIESMFSFVREAELEELEPEELPPEITQLLPSLKAPKVEIVPLTLQHMTIDEILKAIVIPVVPEPVLPEEEWQELFNQLYPEYADMTVVEAREAQMREVLAENKLYNEQMGQFVKDLGEIPDYTIGNLLLEMATMPGVALMEVAGKYFETTSQPIAGRLYKTIIPDIEHLYQQHRATSDSDWEALQKAWSDWDAPGSGVPEFLLKYMLMEGLVDPLTWFSVGTLGISMATTLTGRFARFAVILNKANRVIFAPFEAPFTGIKWVTGKLPKTISQRASVAANIGGQAAKSSLERFAGKGKLLTKGVTMKDWNQIALRAIRYAFDNPQAVDRLAYFGRALLQHEPIGQNTVIRWADRLGLTLTPNQVTREMIGEANIIFEAMFQKFGSKMGKLMTPDEAGGRLLGVFGLAGGSEVLRKTATALLTRRANNIVAEAGAFSRLANPHQALKQMVARNFRYSLAVMKQAEWISKATRIQSFISGTEAKVAAVWSRYIEQTIVRTFAEAYLTFFMYGPMNVIEDVWRSFLGGVFPRRMTVDRFAQLSQGLAVDLSMLDPNLAMSEMIGRIRRKGAESDWNNWVLQLATLGQKDWADKLFTGLVRLPGGFGMDLRRNFVGQKYLTLFREMGGEKVELIIRAEGRLPLLADKKLAREVRQALYDAKTTLRLENISAVPDLFTRKSIYRKELNGILKAHPDLPNSVRDFLLDSFDEDTLFVQGAKSINAKMREANTKLVEEYLKGARLATEQFQNLTDELMKLEVRNPEEMAHLMVNLEIASQVYGATPRQIMAQATIRSRGLPLAERREHFDKIYDDILEFMNRAGTSLEQLTNKMRLTMTKPESMIDWNKVRFVRTTEQMETRIKGVVDDMPINVKSRIEEVRYEPELKVQKAAYDPEGRALVLGKDWDESSIIHEIGHDITHTKVAANDLDFFGKYIQTKFGDRAITQAEMDELFRTMRETGIDYDSIAKVHEWLSIDFEYWFLRPGHLRPKAREFFGENFPKTQRRLPFTPDYAEKSQRLFDLLETKRQLANTFRQENMAWRRETFAGVERKEMTPEWWDDFYRNIDSQYHNLNRQMMRLDGDITRTIDAVDAAAGIQPFSRPAIRVIDRALAPQDVAQLVGARGDDLSRALLDNLTIVNNRDGFVEYVMAMTRSGDVGFTEEAVGAVYDQIAYSLRVKPEAMNWITSKQLEMKAVREELHYLYHSKLLPDNEIAEINRYVVETVEAVKKVAFEPVGVPGVREVVYVGHVQASIRNVMDTFPLPEYLKGLTVKMGKVTEGTRAFYRDGTITFSSAKRATTFDIYHELGHHIMETFGEEPAVKKLIIQAGFAEETFGDMFANYMTKRFNRLSKVERALLDRMIPKVAPSLKPTLKPEFEGLQDLRQQAMDEANKWYYKEYTDYTNANVFDSIMKSIYPFWRYESQRWFWLPRSFVRHPGTFTAFERWQDNTDFGYIPIPGTSIRINPFRGTIYGTLATRLTRRDYPEYYDAWEGASGTLEFMDFLTRWGFYPGAHVGILLALFGGLEPQMGETMPAIWKTPLMLAQAAFPKNKMIEFITDHMFGERFRNYMIMKEVTDRGYNGSLINAKRMAGQPLTDEEQAVWDECRRPVAAYSLLFEQAGLLNLRHREQTEVYKAVSQYIEEKYGYTEDRQRRLRLHGRRIWDEIGGMSLEDQVFLEELGYWQWQTVTSALYPGRQQLVADRLTLDWDEIDRYVADQRSQISEWEQEVMTGGLSAREYVSRVSNLYDKRRDFVDHKQEENPLLKLEERRKYYEEQGIPVPVLHPLREMLNLYFSIEVREIRDPATGELVKDWDTFWAERTMMENAVPDQWKAEWETYLSRHTSVLEDMRREVNEQYFSKYNQVWQKVLSQHDEEEQKLIKEYLYLERMDTDLARQEELQNVVRADGKKLVSGFRTDVANAREALRFANPYLDAWLYFWGRVESFQTPEAEAAYRIIAQSVGKRVR